VHSSRSVKSTVVGLCTLALAVAPSIAPAAGKTESAKHECSKHMGQALDYQQARNGPALRPDPGSEPAGARVRA